MMLLSKPKKTISQIIDDVNHVVQNLNDTILNHAEQTEKIKKLTQLVAQFHGALKSVDGKSNTYQNITNRLKNPKVLDHERLKHLTSEPTKRKLYDFIIENYELQIGTNDNTKSDKFILKANIETDKLEKMSEIFQALSYFDVNNIVKSKASGLIKGILK